jgi:hypothetical protein
MTHHPKPIPPDAIDDPPPQQPDPIDEPHPVDDDTGRSPPHTTPSQ